MGFAFWAIAVGEVGLPAWPIIRIGATAVAHEEEEELEDFDP
jgi:hypothetical protein